MKQFIQSTVIITITLLTAFAVSMLFDLQIINNHISRKILVWILFVLVFYIGTMLVINANKDENGFGYEK